MKKIILMSVVTALFISASADQGSLLGTQIGYSSSNLKTSSMPEENNGGMYINYDFLGMNASQSGFGYGLGLDINVLHPKNSRGISDGLSMYTMGATAKLGYTFENKYNIPLKIKGGVGYGFLDIDVHDAFGLQYEGSAEYAFYKGLGFGAKYKHAEATILGNEININSTIVFISFGARR